MPRSSAPNESRLIAELNDLLQLDHDAVEAYTVAIDLVRRATYRDQLVEYRADHKRHIEELAAVVRARGGLPTELPHATAPLKLAVQALGAAPGDVTLLLAFKAVERQARDKYRRFAARSWPQEVSEVIRRAARDEERHYQWVEGALREQGVGAGTIPHAMASAVEGLHKLLADPIEGLERRVKEQVGHLVGTTRSRGGSEAPSPMDAARGTADATTGAAGGASADAPHANTFIMALRVLEQTGDVEDMVALYDDGAETSGPTDERPHHGKAGARAFWRMYRDSFTEIESRFTNVVTGSDGTVMLEWTSEGRVKTGGRMGYAGVSVVEMQGGRIRRFRTYFDTRDLEQVATPSSGGTTETAPDSHQARG